MTNAGAQAAHPERRPDPTGVRLSRRAATVGLGLTLLVAGGAATASELRTDLRVLNQMRRGDQSRDFEAPTIAYGDFGLRGLPHGASIETYFGLAHDFGRNEGLFTDLYSASIEVPGAIPGVDFTLGRQFLAETPNGAFVADAGKVRFALSDRESLTVFGGAPQYFEPTFSSEVLSQDEQIWGGTLRTTRLRNTSLSLGFLNQIRDGDTLRSQISASGATSLNHLPGLPTLYGSLSYDADGNNLDHATFGTQVFVLPPRLSFNFESTYYKPQDQGKYVQRDFQRREDPIFELYSVSHMLQFRGGLRYTFSPALSAFGDYSYQRYERLAGNYENGHIGSVGIDWLPGGDGLEVVRIEYYGAGSGGGQVNGGRARYESQVYERIVFFVGGGGAHYEKVNNRNDFALHTMTGLGYAVAPGLVCEVNFEANSNQRFRDEYRVGLWLSYNRRHQLAPLFRPDPGAET